jgi:hypothetical protein
MYIVRYWIAPCDTGRKSTRGPIRQSLRSDAMDSSPAALTLDVWRRQTRLAIPDPETGNVPSVFHQTTCPVQQSARKPS